MWVIEMYQFWKTTCDTFEKRFKTSGKQQRVFKTSLGIAGQSVSTAKSILPVKLLLRNMYRLLSKHSSWDATLMIDKPTL
jgi:hypothetical protein